MHCYHLYLYSEVIFAESDALIILVSHLFLHKLKGTHEDLQFQMLTLTRGATINNCPNMAYTAKNLNKVFVQILNWPINTNKITPLSVNRFRAETSP